MNRNEAMIWMAQNPGKCTESVTSETIYKWWEGRIWYFNTTINHWNIAEILPNEEYKIHIKKPADKSLCYAWDDCNIFVIFVLFYDAINDCAFIMDSGERGGATFKNYEEIPRNQWPQWAVDAYDKLED